MILQIDVTVTGPDSVLTGSAAVTVNVPAGVQLPTLTAEAATSPPAAAEATANEQAQKFSQSMRWGMR